MKVLLFGKNGFVGENIIAAFVKQNIPILTPTQSECNLLSQQSVEKYISNTNPNIIINAAFIGVNSKLMYSKKYLDDNLLIIANIVRAGVNKKSIKKIFHLGSSLEYGPGKKTISENSLVAPQNMYGTVKAITTLLALGLAREQGVPLTVVRPFNLYGPFDTKSVVYYVIKSILSSHRFAITKGEQVRDYLYCPDFAEIVYRMSASYSRFEDNKTYNICSGKPTTLHEIFSQIFKKLNYHYSREYLPYSNNEYWRQVGNNGRIKKLITFPKLTSLNDGIGQTIDWVKKQVELKGLVVNNKF